MKIKFKRSIKKKAIPSSRCQLINTERMMKVENLHGKLVNRKLMKNRIYTHGLKLYPTSYLLITKRK